MTPITLNPGDVVTIYENPFDHAKAEGQARLIRKVKPFLPSKRGGLTEIWLVEFEDLPGRPYERIVNVEDAG